MKKSDRISRLENNYGQAAIEYVLMLVVSVAMVIALAMQIFTPFSEFISNYMGTYVGCLLEYGELPTLGGDNPSGPDDDSECNRKFVPATASRGRPPVNNNSSNSSAGGSKSSSSSSSAANRSSSSSSTQSGSNKSSEATHAGSESRGGSRNILHNRRPAFGAESGSGSGGKIVEITLDNKGQSHFSSKNVGSFTVPSSKTKALGLAGLTEAEREKIIKKSEGGGRLTFASDGIGNSSKKTLVKKPEIKTVTEKEQPFTIGNFMRYLLIAAIVIALLIFIGGQALQMSKSFDK